MKCLSNLGINQISFSATEQKGGLRQMSSAMTEEGTGHMLLGILEFADWKPTQYCFEQKLNKA